MLGLSGGIYTSPFLDWSQNAAVRGHLHPRYATEADTVPFSRKLLPFLQFTPPDKELEQRLLFAALDYYLSKTNLLESELIAPCSRYVSSGGLTRLLRPEKAEHIPLAMRQDANRLTNDEDFHAMAEEVVVCEAAQALNIQRRELVGGPSYLEAYSHDLRTLNEEDG